MSVYNNLTTITHDLEANVKPSIANLGHAMIYTQAIIGDYKFSARNEDYLGWLVCDGRLVEREAYPALFQVVGTSFGSSASDNFRLPDLRGRVFGGIGAGSGLTNRSLGDIVGEERHTLSITEMPSHDHGGVTSANGNHNHGGVTSTNGSHTHTHNADGGNTGLAFKNTFDTAGSIDNDGFELDLNSTAALSINAAGDHNHTIATDGSHSHTISSQGGGQSHNVMQPTAFCGTIMIFAGLPGVVPGYQD
jgi:microcystin-dependent protein